MAGQWVYSIPNPQGLHTHTHTCKHAHTCPYPQGFGIIHTKEKSWQGKWNWPFCLKRAASGRKKLVKKASSVCDTLSRITGNTQLLTRSGFSLKVCSKKKKKKKKKRKDKRKLIYSKIKNETYICLYVTIIRIKILVCCSLMSFWG